MNSWWSSAPRQWLMPKQHSWCSICLLACRLKPNQSEVFPYRAENTVLADSVALVYIVPTSQISSLKSSSSVACPTGFLLRASTFPCFNPGLCKILKLKSCSMSIHLPLLPFAFDTVANYSSGLWSVLRVKWFL